jgi:hypothetical protein
VTPKNARTLSVRIAICIATSFALTGCAHDCPTREPPESSWAEQLACSEHTEIDYQPPIDRVGCYRLAIGPSYLTNASTGTNRVFMENPEFVELTSEWHDTSIRRGYLARTPPGAPWWADEGVWRPTRDGGALIDLGSGFAGMMLRMRRSGVGYAGSASMYNDLGAPRQRSTADLWPVSCEKMRLEPDGDDSR